ncbi:MAG: hypothetical protein Ct9H300mP28_26970 [Pseudomonadota bacterium]|nr:MAG: hypothetical protein Ct9H300mP28_26970 [Pseudomonadota bacterium]
MLGLPESIVWRHPFPGPGLSKNVLCARGMNPFREKETTFEEVRNCLKNGECDHLVLPVRSVGVQGIKGHMLLLFTFKYSSRLGLAGKSGYSNNK